jgi:hypothetical protein
MRVREKVRKVVKLCVGKLLGFGEVPNNQESLLSLNSTDKADVVVGITLSKCIIWNIAGFSGVFLGLNKRRSNRSSA